MAKQEGLLSDHNVLAGLRTRLSGLIFKITKMMTEVSSTELKVMTFLKIGQSGVIEKRKSFLPKDLPIYISVDIYVLDPSAAPVSGTVPVGCWLIRELILILPILDNQPIVSADVVVRSLHPFIIVTSS